MQITDLALKKWRNSLFLIFAQCGMVMASWNSRLPRISEDLGIDYLQLGTLIFGLSVGSIVGLVASSHVITWLGTRKSMLFCGLLAAIGFIFAGASVTVFNSFALTFLGLALMGAGYGLCDVAMNLSGARNERAIGKNIMPIYHAFFSFGTVIGAGLGALSELLHLTMWQHVLGTSVLLVTMLVYGYLNILPAADLELHQDNAAPTEATKSTWKERLTVWRDSSTYFIGLVIVGMAFAEGSANEWLAKAMVDGHLTDKTWAAGMTAVFFMAMTLGRLLGSVVLDRFGRILVLRVSAVSAIAGLTIFIFVDFLPLVAFGVVLWGLGAALGFPVSMSAAADDPAKATARVSAVATLGYFAFLVGPPVIGWLSNSFGILNALLLVLVLVVISGLATPAVREPAPPAKSKSEDSR